MQAFTRPPRCTLANVETGETLPCLFNPNQLTERIEVSYQRLGALGQPREELHFQHRRNRVVPGLEFYVDAFGGDDIEGFRSFLRALTAPAGGAPPRALFVWPRVLTLEGVVMELEFKYTHFGVEGGVLVYTASLTLEEARARVPLRGTP